MDRWIVYLGMAIMLAFLYLLYCASHTHYSLCAPQPFFSSNFREDDHNFFFVVRLFVV